MPRWSGSKGCAPAKWEQVVNEASKGDDREDDESVHVQRRTLRVRARRQSNARHSPRYIDPADTAAMEIIAGTAQAMHTTAAGPSLLRAVVIRRVGTVVPR